MRFSTIIMALVSAITVSALPTTGSTTVTAQGICSCDTSASVGSTLFKKENPTTCGNVATDYTTIPTDQGCFNLSNIFGGWESNVMSLVVAKGQKCDFYTEAECPSTNAPLCLGSKTSETIKMTIPKAYQGKIKSAKCIKL